MHDWLPPGQRRREVCRRARGNCYSYATTHTESLLLQLRFEHQVMPRAWFRLCTNMA